MQKNFETLVQFGARYRLGSRPIWSGPIWSADERAFALVRTVEGGGELWVADPYTAAPQRVDGVRLNQVMGL